MRPSILLLGGLIACGSTPPDVGFGPNVKNSGGDQGTIVGNPGMASGTGSFRLAPAFVSPAATARVHILGLRMTGCEDKEPSLHERAVNRTIDLSDAPDWPISIGIWCAMDVLLQPPVVIRQTPRVGLGLDIELDVEAIHLEAAEPFKVLADGDYVLELGEFGWLDAARDVAEDGSAYVRPGAELHDQLAEQLIHSSALFDRAQLDEPSLSRQRAIAEGANRKR